MTTRTIPYHQCPASGKLLYSFALSFLTFPLLYVDLTDSQSIKSERNSPTNSYFLWLLDAHNVGQSAGVPEDVFREIFYACTECGRYMTQRVSFNHRDSDWDDWDFSDSESPLCVYLRGKLKSERSTSAVIPL